MNEFIALRAKARERRDKGIAELRAEYAAVLREIAHVEQNLLGRVSTRYQRISDAVHAVIPPDRTFTIDELLASLETRWPGRVWRRRAIDHQISRLKRKSIIKRIRRATIHESAVYCRADLPIPVATPKTLWEVVRDIVTRPMRVTEIAVAVRESGYSSSMKPGDFRNTIQEILRERGYKRAGDQWAPTKQSAGNQPPARKRRYRRVRVWRKAAK